MEKIDSDSLIKFWDWFKSVSKDLLVDPTRSDLIYQIDSRINKFGRFDWEIGPWKEETYYFTISPNLDTAKLEFTREFVKNAPKCAGWHFLPSKPPKSDWQGIWKMRNEMGKEILVDSNNWKYILYEFQDETFDMDIMIDAVDGDNDTINTAIDIALTGYLGEETFMQLIKNIKIVSSFDVGYQSTATLIKHIKKHIESILH
ncbi:hypothetical protein [Mucilaginibacter sp. L3T2-6]|uniref:hypothetical protein n=1 Tax=Mucilaginibacter sp. L3T2-6 TaxID=3062491 RepID=UPI0026765FAC|nr:hypothetical protein [Mucilaginibacter sp. L3T2-6]MDO3644567.1 hypothetical protein [Mucilaginibacter sp. L3T2-6]MDV6217061.1 hypothetical protein [Mucilaginibacter sp. L3T2-6]